MKKKKYKYINFDNFNGKPIFRKIDKPIFPLGKPQKEFIDEQQKITILYENHDMSSYYDLFSILEEINKETYIPIEQILSNIINKKYKLYLESEYETEYYDDVVCKLRVKLGEIGEIEKKKIKNQYYESELKIYDNAVKKYKEDIKIYKLELEKFKELESVWEKEYSTISEKLKEFENQRKKIEKEQRDCVKKIKQSIEN